MERAYDTATEAMRVMGYEIKPRTRTSFISKTFAQGDTIEKHEGNTVFVCFYDTVLDKYVVNQY